MLCWQLPQHLSSLVTVAGTLKRSTKCWATGTLGKIIALAALIVGIGFGLVRQSVIAAVIGISMALVLNFGPSVISNILTATGEVDMAGVAMLANGLGM